MSFAGAKSKLKAKPAVQCIYMHVHCSKDKWDMISEKEPAKTMMNTG